jgi:hypothetical protein
MKVNLPTRTPRPRNPNVLTVTTVTLAIAGSSIPKKMPQAARERLAKRRKNLDEMLKGKDNYTEWEEIMRSNLWTSGCWDIVSGEEIAPPRPDPFYTSRNRPTGVRTLRQVEAEYGQRNRANHYIHNDESCKERVQEIKDQVTGYESHTRLREKAKNLMMDSITKDLWHQRVNKDDPAALWQELRNDYHKAGVPELGKELAKYADTHFISFLTRGRPTRVTSEMDVRGSRRRGVESAHVVGLRAAPFVLDTTCTLPKETSLTTTFNLCK